MNTTWKLLSPTMNIIVGIFFLVVLAFGVMNIPIGDSEYLSAPVARMPVKVMKATWAPFTDGCRVLELQPVRMLDNNVPELLDPQARRLSVFWCPTGRESWGTQSFLPEVFVLDTTGTSDSISRIINSTAPFNPERIPKISGDNMATIIGAADVGAPRSFLLAVGLEIVVLLSGLVLLRVRRRIALGFLVVGVLGVLWYATLIATGSTLVFTIILLGFAVSSVVMMSIRRGGQSNLNT